MRSDRLNVIEPGSLKTRLPGSEVSYIWLRRRLVLGNLLGHLNRSGALAVLGDFLLALDVSGATATLRLLTMLLTHGGSVLGL